jgi:hypothetical protein
LQARGGRRERRGRAVPSAALVLPILRQARNAKRVITRQSIRAYSVASADDKAIARERGNCLPSLATNLQHLRVAAEYAAARSSRPCIRLVGFATRARPGRRTKRWVDPCAPFCVNY